MTDWKHLFAIGEYPERKRILAQLEVQNVGTRPPGATHSIYEELWHLTKWQSTVLAFDWDRGTAWIEGDRYPPTTGPVDAAEWRALVTEFLTGLDSILEFTQSKDKLGEVLHADITVHDVLLSLAVHNAYHLGKIVARCQQQGSWGPAQ